MIDIFRASKYSGLNRPQLKRWVRIIGCLMVTLLFSTAIAHAAVVKSKGVQRVVDGPKGEVVVDSVMEMDGTPYNDNPATAVNESHSNMPSTAPTESEAAPSEPNYDKIEYHEPTLATEETETRESNSTLKLVIVGVLVLFIGLGVVVYLNKRED